MLIYAGDLWRARRADPAPHAKIGMCEKAANHVEVLRALYTCKNGKGDVILAPPEAYAGTWQRRGKAPPQGRALVEKHLGHALHASTQQLKIRSSCGTRAKHWVPYVIDAQKGR